MDPLTITCTIVSLTAKCLSTAKTLYHLKERYKDASVTIMAMSSECTVISASLSWVQHAVLDDPEAVQIELNKNSGLIEIFDTCLTGCILVLSIVDGEAQKLNVQPDGIGRRVELLWKEERMKELLQQIRGQQAALTLLIQALQLKKLGDFQKLLEDNKARLHEIREETLALRRNNPTIRSPTLISDLHSDDSESLFSLTCSFATSTAFDFDDVVVNSTVYRRTLATLRNPLPISKQNEEVANVADLQAAEERYNARLQKLTQRCEEAESQLNTAQTNWITTREKYQKLKALYWDNEKKAAEKHEAVTKMESTIENLHEAKFAAQATAQAAIEEKEAAMAAMAAMQANINVTEKANSWMLTFTTACDSLKRQYEEILPAVDALKEENAKRQNVELELRESDKKIQMQEARIEELNDICRLHVADRDDLKHECLQLQLGHDRRTKELREIEAMLEAREVELSEYKRFDALIEQVKAISNVTSPISTPGSSLNGSELSG